MLLVQPPGIEPGSPALQTGAMTTSAKVAIGRGDEIRTHDTDFKDQCLRPLGDTPINLISED